MNPYTGDVELDNVVREKVAALPKELRRILDDQATEIYIRTFGAKAGLSEEQTDKLVSEVIMLILGVTPLEDFALILMTELDMIPRLAFAVESWVTGTLLHEVTSLLGASALGAQESSVQTVVVPEPVPAQPATPTPEPAPTPIPEPVQTPPAVVQVPAPEPTPIPPTPIIPTLSQAPVPIPVPVPTPTPVVPVPAPATVATVPREPAFQPPVPSIQSKPIVVVAPAHEVFIQRAVPKLETEPEPAPIQAPPAVIPAPAPTPAPIPSPLATPTPQVPTAPRLTVTHAQIPAVHVPSIPKPTPIAPVVAPPKLVIPPIKISIPTTISTQAQAVKSPLQAINTQAPKIYTILSDIERFRAGMASSEVPRYATPLTETPKY